MNLSVFNLSGKRALVTGSSRGIGLAIAKGLAEAGAQVVLNGRDPDRLEAAVTQMRESGVDVYGYAFDVTVVETVHAQIERIENEVGSIDVLFNNAGMQFRTTLEDYPYGKWRELMTLNVDSVFVVSQAVARHMIRRGKGKIINICSVTSEIARPGIAPYATTKGALRMLTKGMCADWAKHGLQVNGIGPGYFKTELNKALVDNPEFSAWVEKRTPAGRWGNVEELAGAAVFLASEASSFVNGHILYVDGGLTSVL